MKTIFSVWQGRIAPVFDTATEAVELLHSPEAHPRQRQHTLPPLLHERIEWLHAHNITTLVCGALSRCWQLELENAGIRVIPFISGALADVITGWQQNQLDNARFAMPGCCGRRGRGCVNGRGRAMRPDNGPGRGCGQGYGMRQHRFQQDATMHPNTNTQNKGE